MENDTLSNILADGTTAEVEQEGQEFDHTYDLTDEDLVDDEAEETFEESEEADEEVDEGEDVQETPTNRAFAQMRTQNKEFQSKFEELDTLAKGLGMNGVDDLIAAVKDTQIKQTAKSKGIPVEVARELDEMVNEIAAQFAGGELSEEAMDGAMAALNRAYWIAKENNKKIIY